MCVNAPDVGSLRPTTPLRSQLSKSGNKSFSSALVLHGQTVESTMWQAVCVEVREMAWLVSVIGALSALGVGLAVALAAA